MEPVYRANALHLRFAGRTAQGKLTVTPDRIRFESELGQVEMPLAGLSLRRGGNNNEQLFFSHPLQSEWSIYTSENAILDTKAFASEPSLARQTCELRSRRRSLTPLVVIGALGVFVLLLVVLALGAKDRAVRHLASKIPVAWEIEFGDSLFEQMQREGKIVTDQQLDARLASVTSRLLPGIKRADYSFRFHLLEDTNINAFALPGGNVVVLTGLLKAVAKPEELAGVLAHEIAHVTERHGFQKIIESAGLYILAQALFGDATGLTRAIAGSSQFLLQQKYSRNFEREADDVGWNYLVEANINPRGMIDFFKRLNEIEAKQIEVPALLRTHPTTEDRIRRLEAKWAAQERKSGFAEFPNWTNRN